MKFFHFKSLGFLGNKIIVALHSYNCFRKAKPFFSFWRYWSLNSGLTLEPLHQPCFVLLIFEIGSWELFAWAWLPIVILLISAS
jgi:hypothetical protein